MDEKNGVEGRGSTSRAKVSHSLICLTRLSNTLVSPLRESRIELPSGIDSVLLNSTSRKLKSMSPPPPKLELPNSRPPSGNGFWL